MPQRPSWLNAALIALLAVNALDVTTSLIPSPADHLVPVPARSPGAWIVQLALLVPLSIFLARRMPALLAAYRSLPIPALPRGVLAVFFAVAVGHVALRLERYPWSPVAMFSSAVPPTSGKSYSRMGYVMVLGNHLEAISFLREGSPLFARHRLGFDYKAGWAMHLYAPTVSRARDVLFEQIVEREGLPEPIRTGIRYSRVDGHLMLRARRR